MKKTIEVEWTSSGSNPEYFQQTAQHLKWLKKALLGGNQNTVLNRIGNSEALVEPDSGGNMNVMDGYQFKALELEWCQ